MFDLVGSDLAAHVLFGRIPHHGTGKLASIRIGNVELDERTPYLVLGAADERIGCGAELPLRDDLAADLRGWMGDRLANAQAEARDAGNSIPACLSADSRLFNVPSGLIRAFDGDLVAAGIARIVFDANGKKRIDKTDNRGRTLDIHALRHTFGTHLSASGANPRTAQAAMRHGSIDLTMNSYTDPRLLDVKGAVDNLPALPLDGDEKEPSASRARATGTDGKLVPMLVRNAGNRCTKSSKADPVGDAGDSRDDGATSYVDKSSNAKANVGKKRAMRLELTTFSLEGRPAMPMREPRSSAEDMFYARSRNFANRRVWHCSDAVVSGILAAKS